MMPRNPCAVPSCMNTVHPAVFLCWSCLQKVPESVRNLVDTARARMSFGYGEHVMRDYRQAKDSAIKSARIAAASKGRAA